MVATDAKQYRPMLYAACSLRAAWHHVRHRRRRAGVPWVPAKKHFSHVDDGLAQCWRGRVWMNPPFSELTPWVEKFVRHKNGIALVPPSKSRWFNLLWQSDAKLVFLPSNIRFIKEGKPHSIFIPVMLAAFSDRCVEAISRIGKPR